MLEAAVLIDKQNQPRYWHAPAGRTAGSLPDSRALWEAIWSLRSELAGLAHTHPGGGPPAPSGTDLRTFVAIEAALNQRLTWWIASSDTILAFRKRRGRYVSHAVETPEWLPQLYELSKELSC